MAAVLRRDRNWCNFREWGKLTVTASFVGPTSTLYTQHLLITGWDLHCPHYEQAHSQVSKHFSPYLCFTYRCTPVCLHLWNFQLCQSVFTSLLSACLSYRIGLLAFLVSCRQLGDLLQPSIYLSVLAIFFLYILSDFSFQTWSVASLRLNGLERSMFKWSLMW